MIDWRAVICVSFSTALLATVAVANAGETLRISCKRTSQKAFDQAMAMIERARADANSLFKELSNKDPDCPILHWGIAVTAGTPQEQQDAAYHAYVTLAVGDANRQECERIMALP